MIYVGLNPVSMKKEDMLFKREAVYSTSKAKIYKINEGTYEVHVQSVQAEDGIYKMDWHLLCTYGVDYCRDFLGRVRFYDDDHDPYQDALKAVQEREEFINDNRIVED